MPLDPDTRYLIVNADDFGMHASYDDAIVAAHERGIVTSTSLAATGASFAHAVAAARAAPRLGVGVHLVLHDETPVLDPARVPSLVGHDGRLRPLREQTRRALVGELDPREVEAEWRAQIRRVIDAGIVPDHVDGHCHLTALPSLGPIAQRVAREAGVSCARRSEADRLREFASAPVLRWPVSILITGASRSMRGSLSEPLRTPDRFVGLVKSGELDVEWVLEALRALEPGRVSELMTHPSLGGEPGDPHGDHGPARRRAEFDAMVSPRVRDAVNDLGVRLVDYRFLAAC